MMAIRPNSVGLEPRKGITTITVTPNAPVRTGGVVGEQWGVGWPGTQLRAPPAAAVRQAARPGRGREHPSRGVQRRPPATRADVRGVEAAPSALQLAAHGRQAFAAYRCSATAFIPKATWFGIQ
jgi:hypothetical protein